MESTRSFPLSLRWVIPFTSEGTEALKDHLHRLAKAAQFTAVRLDLALPPLLALPLYDLADQGIGTDEGSARQLTERWLQEFRQAMINRAEIRPQLRFQRASLAPDPRHPKAIVLPLDGARRNLRPYHVAMQRTLGRLPEKLPWPSITLQRLPTARGTTALHNLLTHAVPEPHISFVPDRILLIRPSGQTAAPPSIIQAWDLPQPSP